MIYDAVIIGSGLGGLSCAAYMARHGWKLLVLEKHGIPGGYATSFRRGDFTFDAVLHMIDGVGKGQKMRRLLEECGVADKIEFVKIKDFGRIILPDYDLRLPSGDIEGVVSILENAFPHERKGIRSLFRHMTRIFEDQMRFSISKAPFPLQLPFFPFLYRALFPVVNKTCSQLFDKHVQDEKLKAVIYANCFYYGLPPSRLNMPYGVGPNMDYWTEGAYYPKGGNQAIPDAFVDVIKQNGGDILFHNEVVRIITENGKATGVVTGQKVTHQGRKIVSNASPYDTFLAMVGKEKFPPKFISKLDHMEPSISCFVVYLGLDAGFTAALNNTRDYEIFVSDTYDLDQDYQSGVSCDVEKASFIMTLYSNVDSSLAKNNKFVMGLMQIHGYEYWKRYVGAYTAGKKEEYNREKERLAKILIKKAERIVPDISKHIEVMEVATPLTLKRYTGNYNGASYGWANTVRQSNPLQRSPQKTPIKNLFLSSAWTFPGEGQMGVILSGWRLGRRLAG